MNDLTKEYIEALGTAPNSANDQRPKRERVAVSKVLPTDRLSFEKQREILRAFAAEYAANGNNAVAPDKAGSLVQLSGSTISQSVAFFCDIGIIARHDKGGFVPSAELIDYNISCQWDETEARSKIRPLFEKTWFARALIPRVQLAVITDKVCLSILSGESKAGPEHEEKLKHLLRYLEWALIISVSGGVVSLAPTAKIGFQMPDAKPAVETTATASTAAPLEDHEEHSLFLDKDKKKKFTISSPLSISKADYDRICKWIEVTLIIEEDKK